MEFLPVTPRCLSGAFPKVARDERGLEPRLSPHWKSISGTLQGLRSGELDNLVYGINGTYRPQTPGREGSLWAIQGCAAQQGMVFASLSLEQGLQISVSVWNMLGVRVTFFLPELCCKKAMWCCCSHSCPAACLLEDGIPDSKVNCVSHSGTGYPFSPFCLSQILSGTPHTK